MAVTDIVGYAGMAETWATGAALAYGPMAEHLVERAPVPLDGALALDAGAGSGVAGRAMRARGARVVAADLEFDMAAFDAAAGPAVTADVTALPFREGSFDVVTAAFVVNHLPDPAGGLAELRRVTRPGGAVLASTFSGDRSAAKLAVDEVVAGYGFVAPDWYLDFRETAQGFEDPDAVERAVAAAGFAAWTVTETAIDVGLGDPADVVRYRLGMPHLHRFAVGLTDDVRRELFAEAVEAVRRTGERFAPLVVEAVATA
ncbi:MAG TPA: class I SAM-dependent methyltransferase [Nocardioides sp.]|uniref:class I SAM-dependent methyltransferase n=1 Tax=Nocardioides sp. TaxID=35761 RepID=UPI002E3109F4|nr:class I SAM-dependent methyltransferase [Nocardioides sp.]HEX5088239.1 class I SAM-dependent methyltransferase [Nocardioides sp.]